MSVYSDAVYARVRLETGFVIQILALPHRLVTTNQNNKYTLQFYWNYNLQINFQNCIGDHTGRPYKCIPKTTDWPRLAHDSGSTRLSQTLARFSEIQDDIYIICDDEPPLVRQKWSMSGHVNHGYVIILSRVSRGPSVVYARVWCRFYRWSVTDGSS